MTGASRPEADTRTGYRNRGTHLCVPAGAPGFTLLEMLLAVSIFALIVSVIFSSFRVGIGAWESGERDIATYQKLRAVTEILYREITSTYPYMVTPGEIDRHKRFFAFFGKSDSIKFVSCANLHKRDGGLSLIDIWVEGDEGLMLGEGPALAGNLKDLEDVPVREKENTIVLSPDVKKIELRFYERKRGDDDGEWVSHWDPKDKGMQLPHFVEIALTFSDRKDDERLQRLIIPVMVKKI